MSEHIEGGTYRYRIGRTRYEVTNLDVGSTKWPYAQAMIHGLIRKARKEGGTEGHVAGAGIVFDWRMLREEEV
jgi:hypothetical protein